MNLSLSWAPNFTNWYFCQHNCIMFNISLNLLKTKRPVNTLHFGYKKTQFFNFLQGKICCSFRDRYKTHKFRVIIMWNFLNVKHLIRIVTGRLQYAKYLSMFTNHTQHVLLPLSITGAIMCFVLIVNTDIYGDF